MTFVDVAQVIDIFYSTVAFIKSFGGVKFNHVVCSLPIKVYLGFVINCVDDGHFKSLFTALFELWQSHVKGRESFFNFSFFVKSPKVEEFVLSFFIRGEDRQIVVFGSDILDHGGNLCPSSLNDFEGRER